MFVNGLLDLILDKAEILILLNATVGDISYSALVSCVYVFFVS